MHKDKEDKSLLLVDNKKHNKSIRVINIDSVLSFSITNQSDKNHGLLWHACPTRPAILSGHEVSVL